MQFLLWKELFPPPQVLCTLECPERSSKSPRRCQHLVPEMPKQPSGAQTGLMHDVPVASVPSQDWFNFHWVWACSCMQQFLPQCILPSVSMSAGQLPLWKCALQCRRSHPVPGKVLLAVAVSAVAAGAIPLPICWTQRFSMLPDKPPVTLTVHLGPKLSNFLWLPELIWWQLKA